MRYLLSIFALALAACDAGVPPEDTIGAGAAAPEIAVSDALIRTPPGGREITAGYMTLANSGGADALIGVSSGAAGRIELHTHSNEGGVMKMRQVERVEIPAGGEVAFEPGSYHLMIFGAGALAEGDTVALTLDFETADDQTVAFTVGGVQP